MATERCFTPTASMSSSASLLLSMTRRCPLQPRPVLTCAFPPAGHVNKQQRCRAVGFTGPVPDYRESKGNIMMLSSYAMRGAPMLEAGCKSLNEIPVISCNLETGSWGGQPCILSVTLWCRFERRWHFGVNALCGQRFSELATLALPPSHCRQQKLCQQSKLAAAEAVDVDSVRTASDGSDTSSASAASLETDRVSQHQRTVRLDCRCLLQATATMNSRLHEVQFDLPHLHALHVSGFCKLVRLLL